MKNLIKKLIQIYKNEPEIVIADSSMLELTMTIFERINPIDESLYICIDHVMEFYPKIEFCYNSMIVSGEFLGKRYIDNLLSPNTKGSITYTYENQERCAPYSALSNFRIKIKPCKINYELIYTDFKIKQPRNLKIIDKRED